MFGSGSNRGSSNTPPSPNPFTAGRGSMPTGDRFQIDFQPMPQPPSVVAPGKGAVPVEPFSTSGLPNRIDINLPDYVKPAPK
jgi:hypothetical protein